MSAAQRDDADSVDAPRVPHLRTDLPWAGAVFAVSAILTVLVLQLWKADLRVLFDYSSDALSYDLWVKSLLEHGSWLHNPDLGAPVGLDTHDFPCFDVLHLLVIRGFGIFTHNHVLLFNLYFLFGFPLTALTTFLVLRKLRIGPGSALVASLLYAFLPSHLLKGEIHIFMMFWQVPLALLVLMWIADEQPPLFPLRQRRTWIALILCVIIATTDLYYAFFAGFLFVVLGAWAAWMRRNWRPLASAAALSAVILTGLFAQALPSIVYQHRHGKNTQVAQRDSGDSEVYGLKIAQLLLPVDGHRLKTLAELRKRYDATAPLVDENRYSTLGIVGSFGFLFLLGILFVRREHAFRSLAVLNLAALLLGTVGGLGALFAVLVSPQIRTYCRIHVFIALFALTAIAMLLDRLRSRAQYAVLVAVAAIGLLDQTTSAMVRPYATNKAEFASDRDFVARIEARLPLGAAVFQMPYTTYPEAPPTQKMMEYDQLRAYVHSHQLRWSYPMMRGRAGDVWQPLMTERPSRLVAKLVEAGFSGVYVDRFGYDDQGSELEAGLGNVLDQDPMVSADGRLAFFDLRSFKR